MVEGFFTASQRVVSCVTRSVLQGRAYDPDRPHLMAFPDVDGVRLGRRGELRLLVEHYYQLEQNDVLAGAWQVVTRGYEYRLRIADGPSILTYHWHPVGRSPVTYPHLHISGHPRPVDLSKAHLPTGGPVKLTDIIRLTITELGVQPLRPDWQTVLDQAERDLGVIAP